MPRHSVTDHGSQPADYRDLDGEAGYTAAFPPHEHYGRQLDQPPFLAFASSGLPDADDDLRPRPDSPPVSVMPAEIKWIERRIGGILALLFGRARGCYWHRADRLWAAVNGAKQFPG